MNILTNFDFKQNQLENAVLQNLATIPVAPKKGQMYFSTDAAKNRAYCWNGTKWVGMDAEDAVMTGPDIVVAINASASLIDDNNLSVAVNAAITATHTSHAIAAVTGLQTALDGKVDDSQVLTNVPAGALFTDTVYVHPTTAGNIHIPAGGASGNILRWSSAGVAVWGADTDTVYTHPTTTGNRHVPSGGALNQFLKWSADGTAVWAVDNDTITTINGVSGAIAKADIVALGIPAQDTVYVHPVTTGSKHIPAGGAVGQFLKYSADGTAVWSADNDTVYVHPTGDGNLHVPVTNTTNNGKVLKAGATAGSIAWANDNDTITTVNGNTGAIVKADIVALGIPAQDTTYAVFTTSVNGLVPMGGAGTTRYLRQDGTWVVPPNDNTVYTHPTGAGNNHIPTAGTVGQILVNSAAGTAVWANQYTHPAAHTIAEVTGLQTALDAKETPAGAQGKATTALNSANSYTDTAVSNLLSSAPATLDTLNELAAALGDDPNFATTVTNLIAAKPSKITGTLGNGAAISFVVTHNLNTQDAVVTIRETTAPYAQVITDVEFTTVNTLTVKFAAAPTASQYTITIVG